MISVIALTLLGLTGYFVYKVYFKGEMRLEAPVDEKDKEAQYLDEERSVKRPAASSGP